MGNWKHRVKIKDLLDEDESPEAVSKSLNAIADRLEKSGLFKGFPYIERMRTETDINLANDLLSHMYDYADGPYRRIWIE